MDNLKPLKEDLDSFLLFWNNKFKYDRTWRKKHNIAFGSEEHLKANQIDIYLDIREDLLAKKALDSSIERISDLESYEKEGSFLKERIASEEEDDILIKKIDLKKLNEHRKENSIRSRESD